MFPRIQAAQKRLAGHANATPILSSRTLNERLGAEIFLKCENFQRVGAFKFRGAFNAISQLSPSQREKGVLAFSSGNHGQAVALVARMLGIEATVVMPNDAPAIKREATEGYGATVIEYDPEVTDRQLVAQELQTDNGLCLIPPFDHLDVIAGQGTVALEMFEKLGRLDKLLVPCGGGGLLSGSAVVAKAVDPGCEVIGIEPELADDATRSFYSRQLQTVHNPRTVADGTRTPSLGELTFPLVLENVHAMKTVSEEAIAEAVRFLFYRMKLVVEPSGALPVAALLSGAVRASGKIGVILSGGNVDAETLAVVLGRTSLF